MSMPFRIPAGKWIEVAVDWLVEHGAGATKTFSAVAGTGVDLLEKGLALVPVWLFIACAGIFIWRMSRKWSSGLFAAGGFALIANWGLWDATMSTLSLVLVATAITVFIGVPLGIVAAMSPPVRRALMPFLDLMQTMPAFVYLIPAIPFFGLGKVAAIFATVIFAMPPAVRFTCLGIRQVPADLIECADAFGATRFQRLTKLELPLALPTIMAGINQTVMLALSMVVIAAMIGARGLGGEVWRAIQRLNLGSGFEAGIGIVLLAVFLDRLVQSFAKPSQKP